MVKKTKEEEKKTRQAKAKGVPRLSSGQALSLSKGVIEEKPAPKAKARLAPRKAAAKKPLSEAAIARKLAAFKRSKIEKEVPRPEEAKPQPKKPVEIKIEAKAALQATAPKAPIAAVEPKKVEPQAPPKAPSPPPVAEPKATLLAPAPVPDIPAPAPSVQAEQTKKVLEMEVPVSLKELASRINVKPNELIVKLMQKSVFATINQNLGEEIVKDLLSSYGIEFTKPKKQQEAVAKEHAEFEAKQDVRHLAVRSPVVTFMGHVDHGKTSLLDFIRKTRVADKEKGGITQHIGAYEVKFKSGSVTFLDTPGHEAFTAMRARGANATDVVVLVVAADDGVMPQTKEAVDHARAAGVTIVVAINKCDLPSANIDKVKGQLSSIGLSPEDWGGKTITIPVSAKTGEGIDRLLEMLLLEAELLELKANPHIRARGVVIEGRLSSGQGPVATLLVKNGTLRVGDLVLSGMYYGRVKAMMDDKLERIKEAPPSKPVTILGLSGVPMAGDEFFVVKDERKARTLSLLKQDEERSRRLKASKRITLEDFYTKMKEGGVKELAIVLKGDVQGSVEALQKSLLELNTKDVKINIIHSDVGNVYESDVMLAVASNAVVIGFNVRADEGAQDLAAREGIEIKIYGIIYEAIQDVAAAMEGLLEPYSKEVFVGRAHVKQVFKVSKAGTIAGCLVAKGKIVRTGIAKLVRDKEVVYEGKIASLKRFKDDAREVNEGYECGVGLERHDDIKEGDLIEVYAIEKVARRLETRKQ